MRHGMAFLAVLFFFVPVDDHMVRREFGEMFWESVSDVARQGAAAAATLLGLVSLVVQEQRTIIVQYIAATAGSPPCGS